MDEALVGGALAWNKRLPGAPATRGGCCMGDERGRATGEAEGCGCGALAWNKPLAGASNTRGDVPWMTGAVIAR